MALTLTNHGVYEISGADLKVAVDAITLTGAGDSGQGVYFVPLGHGQVQLLEVDA